MMSIKNYNIGQNSTRQYQLDLVRGLCVIFMIINHVNEYFSSDQLLDHTIFHLTQSIVGDVAIFFMFIMGMNLESKKDTPKFIIKRGVKIFIMSYIFNFFRDFLPAYIGTNVLHTSNLASHQYYNLLETILSVDIFQFVGMFMIFLGTILWISPKNWVLLACSIIVSLLTLFPHQHTLKQEHFFIFDNILGYWNKIWFPFDSWVLFPVAGYLFAYKSKNIVNKSYMYKQIFKISGLVYLFITAVTSYSLTDIDFYGWGVNHKIMYYHQNIIGNIYFISEVLCGLSVSYFVIQIGLFSRHTNEVLYFFSKNITSVYVVSWIYISWSAWIIVGFNVINNPFISVFSAIVVVVLSYYTVKKSSIISSLINKAFA